MVGNLSIGDLSRQTHCRFRISAGYEHYINAIHPDYDSQAALFNGYVKKINAPQFNFVDRSRFENRSDFKHQITEYHGKNCWIPSNGYCFIKCINFLTDEDFKQQILDFIRNERRRSIIMSLARIQLCLGKFIIDLG